MAAVATRSGDHHGAKKLFAPTVEEIVRDRLTQLSLQYWAGAPDQLPFDPKVVEDIFLQELAAPHPFPRIMLLELSHYLEAFLWPNFDADKSSVSHVVSIMVMVNEKFRENVSAPWASFHEDEAKFGRFFQRVLGLREERRLTTREEATYLLFLINSFQSLEDPMVRSECLKLVYLPLWLSVTEGRVEEEVRSLPPRMQERWKKLKAASKKNKKKTAKKGAKPDPARTFIPALLRFFLGLLDALDAPPSAEAEDKQQSGEGEAEADERSARVAYCERFVEWLIDLESQLPTRRFFHLVLQDTHIVERCRLSGLAKRAEGSLFHQLVDMLGAFAAFDVNNYSGEALSDEQATAFHCRRIHALQKAAYKLFPEDLRPLTMSNIGAVQARSSLVRHLAALSPAQLRRLAEHLHLLQPAPQGAEGDEGESTEFLLEVLLTHHELRPSQLDKVNELALYPNEDILWDENAVPAATYTGEHCLALPKLNLQFLTFYDYLLRNFNLFRLEATYAIRADVEDAVRRMNPRRTPSGSTSFNGWARMALPIKNFKVTAVRPPKIGEKQPSAVEAEIIWNLADTQGTMRHEWEEIKEHDVLYLVSVRSPLLPGEQPDTSKPFPEQYGVTHCRGCEVAFILDEKDDKVGPPPGSRMTPPGHGNRRRARVLLDPAQYQIDVEKGIVDALHGGFNIVIRRKPKENNFKAILHTIRDLMNSPAAVPAWLHDVFLGYGDPAAARGKQAEGWIDFRDTFLNYDHLRHSFPGLRVAPIAAASEGALQPPFELRFSGEGEDPAVVVEVRPYVEKSRGPYPYDQPKRNAIPFTPKQVSAIRSAMNEGLTMVVGPPGTGKTDVAVQMISNWYHNYPDQRILLITHSNQALNQLFEKIMALDIDERHLLRLGHGQKLLETDKDFGKYGRVEWMLQKRLRNLELVQKLARAIGAEGDFGWSCESAAHLYSLHVRPAWVSYKARLAADPSPHAVAAHFPFARFFDDVRQPHEDGEGLVLFAASASRGEQEEKARGCFRHIKALFTHLDECRPLELLRTGHDRADFLLIKQARIVAMTCTHAALKRADLVRLGFTYDSVLMEEAAQVLEVETFIPLVLQADSARLKRVVLIGDHNQLPPIIRNMAFQRYAHMDQSLFARFVRLGVPTVMLDAQGRARPSLARLFNWRYAGLRDLPGVVELPEFRAANAGLRYEYQLIDVADFHGRGEYEPSPYFYQNLGEAEFLVATYQYMRLLGYPAHSISVITSYNGQKHLLRDVFRRRCGSHPMFGLPHKISTLDRFQGQQNDYVLFSMVRTKAVGHIRDVRRLIVGMSRARLGFYVFCRKALFENCYELTPAFAHLVRRPSRLHLVPNEIHPTTRLIDQDDVQSFVVDNVEHMQALVASHAARIQATLVGAPLPPAPAAETAAPEAAAADEGAKKRKLETQDDDTAPDDDQASAVTAQEKEDSAEEGEQQTKKRKTDDAEEDSGDAEEEEEQEEKSPK